MIDPDGYRPNVGIVLMHPDGRVFWARRVRRDGWQFPQGGMNTDETPLEAMYRELREETGLLPEHVAVLGVTPGWLRYRLPPRAIRRHDRLVCIGQKQVWFLLQFTGSEVRPAPGPDRQARVRPLALGRFLVSAGARGDLQARGLCQRVAPPGAVRPADRRAAGDAGAGHGPRAAASPQSAAAALQAGGGRWAGGNDG